MLDDPGDEGVGERGESSPRSSAASGNAGSSPRQSDMCMCMPVPVRSVNGFGMNVAVMPRCSASIDTRYRMVMTRSAVVRASACLKFCSNWPLPSSWSLA